MKIVKHKSDIQLIGVEPQLTKDNYNYYMLSGSKKKTERNCVFEGSKKECQEFLSNL